MAARLPLSNYRFDHYMSDINRCESFFLQPVSEDEIGNLKNNLNIHKQARSQIFWRGGANTNEVSTFVYLMQPVLQL